MNLPRKILVRAPNWLGDLVMSTGFFYKLRDALPDAEISVVAKSEIADLFDLLPFIKTVHRFSKADFTGLGGLYRFSKGISDNYDMYFCLPPSFSSALMGKLAGAKRRVGFKGNLRSMLFTTAHDVPKNIHRSEEYALLLHGLLDSPTKNLTVKLMPPPDKLLASISARHKIVLNLNSESQSKIVPIEKGLEIANLLLEKLPDATLILTGSKKERAYTEAFQKLVSNPNRVVNMAGKTSIKELASLLAASGLVISTDSGAAHLANAVGTPTLVFYGAGDERNTAPYHVENSVGFRVQGLDCAPCVSTTCKFGEPKCLSQMNTLDIVQSAVRFLQ